MTPEEIAREIVGNWFPEQFTMNGDLRLVEAIAAALTAERERQAEASAERMWCIACGTVSRDDTCDCTKTAETAHLRRAVNYADAQRARAEKAEALLTLYREAVRVDATMEGPRWCGVNASALKRAWEADHGR